MTKLVSHLPISCPTLLGLGLIGALSGCGIEGGGSVVAEQPPPVVVSGIEGGGSVRQFSAASNTLTVGSKQLDVSNPSLKVTIDGKDATLEQLRVGDQIKYSGVTSDNGQTIEAASISQDDLVEGTIDLGTLNISQGSFMVLGQQVVTSELTIYASSISPNDLSGLSEGDFVEISGVINADNAIDASRIELEVNDSDFEVNGIISAVNTSDMTFTLNNLNVDYSSAELKGFSGNPPAAGDRVEVEGSTLVNGQLVADEVELENENFEGDEGELGNVEGLITAVASATEFSLNSQAIRIDGSTEFENGSASNLAIGRRVEVKGSLDANGILVASEIEFDFENERGSNNYKIEGRVESVNSSDQTLVIMGVTVQILLTTRLEGDDDRPLEFSEIATGTTLEVAGSADASSPDVLQAAKVELEDESQTAEVTGPISQIMEPAFDVFGVSVTTGSATEFDGENFSTAAEFFSTVSEGDFLEVKGTYDGSTLTATKVQGEDDE